MTPSSSFQPFGVLYVDDELKALEYFRQAFEDEFVIFTANNAWDGYQILVEQGHRIGVLLTDQRMPGESGVELMEKARQLNPNLVRILVTAYAEYQTAVDAVNAGHAFRYLHKPWNPEELSTAIHHGLRYYQALTEREQLLAEKEEHIRQSLMSDRVAAMGILAEGLNHHVRNAMTVIRAFLELTPPKLAEELHGQPPSDPSFWQGWHAQALQQMDRIQMLLTHLSSASHAKRLQRTDVVHLMEVLTPCLHRYQAAYASRGVDIEVEVDESLPPLVVNAERFHQLINLLLTQGLCDLGQGNTLSITATTSESPRLGQHLLLCVSDNAEWPERERAANVFDPFFVRTPQPEEFGVNRMAAYVIVHLHGGTIEAFPLGDKGLKVEIRIPLDPPSVIDNEATFFNRLMEHEERWRERERLPEDVFAA